MANRRAALLALLGPLAAALPARAQDVLEAELLATGLYLIRGGGGNSLLRMTANGLVLVNGKSPDSYKPLMKAIRRINKLGDMPLRALLLTDAGQAGDSAAFSAARVATVAQAGAAARLHDAAVLSFERDYTLRIGGVEVRMLHAGGERTLVWFADKKVLAIGDLPPRPPRAAVEQALAFDADCFVANEGPVLDRAALQAMAQAPNFSA